MPSEWMRWVWDMERGEDSPEFKDQAQAQRILGLLMRHMNDIAATLHQAPGKMENANRMIAEAGGTVETLIWEASGHCCHDRAHIVRPGMADFMARYL